MFILRLAAHLGMTVRRLLSDLDSVELTEWMAFDRLSPIDTARRAELSAGIIAAATVAPHVSKGNRPTAADYTVDWADRWQRQVELEHAAEVEPEQVVAQLADVFRAMGGTPT